MIRKIKIIISVWLMIFCINAVSAFADVRVVVGVQPNSATELFMKYEGGEAGVIYVLKRMTGQDNNWIEVAKGFVESLPLTDRGLTAGVEYQYAIFDGSGARQLQITPFSSIPFKEDNIAQVGSSNVINPVNNVVSVTAITSTSCGGKIALSWTKVNPNPAGVLKLDFIPEYTIYRFTEDPATLPNNAVPDATIHITDMNQTSYADTVTNASKVYWYDIEALVQFKAPTSGGGAVTPGGRSFTFAPGSGITIVFDVASAVSSVACPKVPPPTTNIPLSCGPEEDILATYIKPGNETWTVPSKVSKIRVKVWGSGGSGGSGSTPGGAKNRISTAGAGGGGGGYAESELLVQTGELYKILVGKGGVTDFWVNAEDDLDFDWNPGNPLDFNKFFLEGSFLGFVEITVAGNSEFSKGGITLVGAGGGGGGGSDINVGSPINPKGAEGRGKGGVRGGQGGGTPGVGAYSVPSTGGGGGGGYAGQIQLAGKSAQGASIQDSSSGAAAANGGAGGLAGRCGRDGHGTNCSATNIPGVRGPSAQNGLASGGGGGGSSTGMELIDNQDYGGKGANGAVLICGIKTAELPKSDLIISAGPTRTGVLVTGQTLSFSATVKNQASATPTSFYNRFQILNSTGTSVVVAIGSPTVAGLISGGTQSVSATWTAVVGTYRIQVCADTAGAIISGDLTTGTIGTPNHHNLVAESDEKNNCSPAGENAPPFTVLDSKPDLTPKGTPDITGPAGSTWIDISVTPNVTYYIPGTTLTLIAQPKNIGSGDVGSNAFKIKFQAKLSTQSPELFQDLPNVADVSASFAKLLVKGAVLPLDKRPSVTHATSASVTGEQAWDFRYCVDMPPNDYKGLIDEKQSAYTNVDDNKDKTSGVGEYNNCSEVTTIRIKQKLGVPICDCSAINSSLVVPQGAIVIAANTSSGGVKEITADSASKIKLVYSSTGATSVTLHKETLDGKKLSGNLINGGVGSGEISLTSLTVGEYYYVFTAINAGGECISKVHFNIPPPAPPLLVTLQVRKANVNPYTRGPLTVNDGDRIDLVWNNNRSLGCSANWSNKVTGAGSDLNVGPLRNSATPYTYTVTCGGILSTVVVNVNEPLQKPECDLLVRPVGGVFGNSVVVSDGSSIELKWTVINGKAISLYKITAGKSDGINLLTSSGSSIVPVQVAGTYKYKLTTSNNASQTCGSSVDVTVNHKPLPDFVPTDAPVVTDISNPGRFIFGDTIKLSAKPKNQGEGTDSPFNVKFQYKSSGQSDDYYTDFPDYDTVSRGLAKNEVLNPPAEITRLTSSSQNLSYEFRYCIDFPPNTPNVYGLYHGAVEESDENNNCSTSTHVSFENLGKPLSLSVACQAVPSALDLAVGQTARWEATIVNGTSPFFYTWTGDGVPKGQSNESNPTVNYDPDNTVRNFKRASLSVTDSTTRTLQMPNNVTADCGAPKTTSANSYASNGLLSVACGVSATTTNPVTKIQSVKWTADTNNSGTPDFVYTWKVEGMPEKITTKPFIVVDYVLNSLPKDFKKGSVTVTDSATTVEDAPLSGSAECGGLSVKNSDDDFRLVAGSPATMNFIGQSTASSPILVTVAPKTRWFDRNVEVSDPKSSTGASTTIGGVPVTLAFYRHGTKEPLRTISVRDYSLGLDMVIKSSRFIQPGHYSIVIYGNGSVPSREPHTATIGVDVNDMRPKFSEF
ncbi:MAG: hypothetical protein EXS46_01060 [Candidatus Taylorbacteria bacterium]|nr:hypothetical protein [Candidatus Taylorbacteria bacterium]